jgi:hypothetical protein
MLRKNGIETTKAFKDILDEGVTCKQLWTDSGGEYYNGTFKNLLEKHNIELYSTYNEPKASIAERFIRTLRHKIEENYVLTDSTSWYRALPRIINEYNNTGHSHLNGMTPREARLRTSRLDVYRCQFSHRQQLSQQDRLPVYQIGDRVRISLVKRRMEKGTTRSWSEEIFTVKDWKFASNIVLYKLQDLLGEPVHGSFYREQLKPTTQEIFRVDKIVRKRTRNGKQELLVQWAGYGSDHNSWTDASNILHSQNK